MELASRAALDTPLRGGEWAFHRDRSSQMFVKRHPFLFCLALLILAAEPIRSQQRAEDKPLVLRGATIIDGLGNSLISEGLIVIERDRIKTVGRKGAAYPPDAHVV